MKSFNNFLILFYTNIKTKPFMGQCNQKEISFLSRKKDWKKSGLNNKLVALNVIYISHNSDKIKHAEISKHNLTREMQITKNDNILP